MLRPHAVERPRRGLVVVTVSTPNGLAIEPHIKGAVWDCNAVNIAIIINPSVTRFSPRFITIVNNRSEPSLDDSDSIKCSMILIMTGLCNRSSPTDFQQDLLNIVS